jgi:17beta-estradiol 17-dehydrogenase / very-long-chain 3-oxoacyl-CoA reductase
MRKFGPKGSWAVVTGASDGIGREFALQLAQKGFNIMLVSRTQSKLDTVAQEIETKHANTQTKTFALDFASAGDDEYAALDAALKPLEPAVLINNVGLSHSIPVPFIETSLAEMTGIITVNNLATLRVTQLVAPGMAARKRGLILTMASFGGALPTPLLATYSGSKAFLQQWSASLGSELEPSGVVVRCVQSYLVTSAMSKIRRASAMIPTPKAFVRATLGSLGRKAGAQGMGWTSTPYWSHAFLYWALREVVGTTSEIVVNFNRRMHVDIRRRALRKAEREAKKGK